jgi:RNA recognition motif-containing protein
MADRDRSPRRDRRSGGGGPGARPDLGKMRKGPADKRIFISNLPYEMKWQEVKDLFRQEVGEVSYVELFYDESGKPRGAGVMEFPTQDMARLAIDKMHRYDYKGRKIIVREKFEENRDARSRIVNRSRDSRGRDNRPGGDNRDSRPSGDLRDATPGDYGNLVLKAHKITTDANSKMLQDVINGLQVY